MNLLSGFKRRRPEYYKGINDMPLFNWIECHNGKIEFTRKTDAGTPEKDIEAWQSIYDDYIRTFGLTDVQKKLFDAMKKRAILELDYVITGDRFKLTEIEIAIARIDSMLSNKGSGITIEQALIHVSKWLGQWINPRNITVKEYFNLLEQYGKANKGQ
jgi:hypothetical protein